MGRDEFYQLIQDRASTLLNEGYTLAGAYKAIMEQVQDLAPKTKGRKS